jgi:sugar phosphate isomerase/epimerase
MDNKLSVGVWAFGMGTDRYVGEGYKDYMTFEERVRAISKLDGVDGIEITYPGDINEDNYEKIKPLLDEGSLSISGMGVELVCDKEWKDGSLSAIDPARRAKSVKLVKKAMDFAVTAGVKTVCLWLGQDGFDYVFQNDYAKAYQYLVDSLKECAIYNPKVNLGLEYKVSEPKMSCMVKNAGMALAIAQATGCENVGITLDVGHAFNAGENPAEVASILHSQNRLFHIHINDNYRIADDDMPVGSVHWPQYFEFFYWMKRLGYKGWYSLDQYPYRDDPSEACKASITFVNGAVNFVNNKLPDDFVTGTEAVPSRKLQELFQMFFAGGLK